MGTKAAPEEDLEPDVNEDELADWEIDFEDEEEEAEPASPEPGAEANPAAPAAQVEADAALPGDAAPPAAADAQPTSPSAPADRSEASPPDAQEEKVVPWSFSADGKSVTVPRSQVFETVVDPATGRKERFVLLPESEIQRSLQPHLADRGAWREKERGYLEKIAELSLDTHPEIVKAKELSAFLFGLFEKGDDEILAAIEEMRAGRPAWEAQQELAAANAKLAARESVQIDPDPELQRLNEAEMEEQLGGALRTHIGTFLQRPELKGITPERAWDILWPLRREVFFEASEDLPKFGLKKGDIGIDLRYAGERLKQEAEYLKGLLANTTKAQTIEQQNRDAVGTPRPPQPAATPNRAKRKQKEEPEDEDPWRDLLADDDDD